MEANKFTTNFVELLNGYSHSLDRNFEKPEVVKKSICNGLLGQTHLTSMFITIV